MSLVTPMARAKTKSKTLVEFIVLAMDLRFLSASAVKYAKLVPKIIPERTKATFLSFFFRIFCMSNLTLPAIAVFSHP